MPTSNDEKSIDNLLIYMNDILEDRGLTPNLYRFSFGFDEEDNLALGSLYNWTSEDVIRIVKICRTRSYVKGTCMGCGPLSLLALTTSGQRRALAAKIEKNKPRETSVYEGKQAPPRQTVDKSIHVNTNASVIVGNNNVQTAHNHTAPPNPKNGILRHPMATTLVAVIGGIIAAIIGAYITMSGGS
ncbi:hypothetical protein [uncultured Pseudodesulfovibrio sp.]|uniref:hypothetical protein n=1 Tax=uncultured Pseudodesulfovibrio sp. TaxID=2035858 RepID=UPI0029C71E57|nr:hypothetical protein [uncultured Pseudodesulfovibrio sp.]